MCKPEHFDLGEEEAVMGKSPALASAHGIPEALGHYLGILSCVPYPAERVSVMCPQATLPGLPGTMGIFLPQVLVSGPEDREPRLLRCHGLISWPHPIVIDLAGLCETVPVTSLWHSTLRHLSHYLNLLHFSVPRYPCLSSRKPSLTPLPATLLHLPDILL